MVNKPSNNLKIDYNMVKTMPFSPPMTGNGKHTTHKNDDFGDGLLFIIVLLTSTGFYSE